MLWSVVPGNIAALLLALPLLAIGGWLLKRAQGEAQSEANDTAAIAVAAARKGSVPVNTRLFLYLRPFASTNIYQVNPYRRQLFSTEMFDTSEHDDIERYAATGLIKCGTFVALGQPGEHLGAGRVLIPEDGWQTEILNLANAATLILLLPSHRSGTLWEIEQLIANGHLNKTAFIMPPLDDFIWKAEKLDVADEWRRTQEACNGLGLALPDASFGGALFRFVDGKVTVIEGLPVNQGKHWVQKLRELYPQLV